MTSMPPRFAATVIGQLSGEELHARALIQRIAQRSDSALRELNRLVQRRIYAFALQRLGRTDEAATVVNETLWEVWRRAASFDGSCKVTTWMLGIARYKALELMRARSAHADDLDSVKESLADANADPFDRIAALQLSTELLRGIAGLAVEQRLAVEAYYLRGESIDAIATAQACPKGTVQTRLLRAREQLRKRLGSVDACRRSEPTGAA